MADDNDTQGRIYRPNTFQMPNAMIDIWLTELTGSEFKVAAYICRHTYGWNKESDGISLSQMMNGVRRRDGTYLDHGTGIKSKETLLTALRSLEKQGRIRRDRRRSIERGDEPTVYRLVIVDEEPAEEEIPPGHEGGQKIGPPVGGISDQGGGKNFRPGGWSEIPPTQNTLEQNPSLQNPYINSKDFELETQTYKDGSTSSFSKKSNRRNQNSANGLEVGLSSKRRDRGELRPIATALEARVADLRASAQARTEQDQPRRRGRPPQYPATPAIEVMLTDWTVELNDDPDHARSNVSQAARYWHESGVSEDTFRDLLYEARRRTKGAGNIEKLADGEAGKMGLRNRMPYFFECLKTIIRGDLKRQVQDRAPASGQGKSSRTKGARAPNVYG
jgi:hypothetical protein